VVTPDEDVEDEYHRSAVMPGVDEGIDLPKADAAVRRNGLD
jgi:hypothetical protein